MQEWMNKNGLSDSKAFLDYANSLVEYYGQAVGSLACQMYEEIAAAQGVAVRMAEMADIPKYGEVAKAVNGAKKQSEKLIPSAVGRMVKQVGADTTLKNAMRDGAQFAWIPSGDTCAFCLMLASRGWQYMSKKALKNGHAEHIHANCDCQYAVRFDGKSTVQGYDPDKYLDMYNNAEGETWEEKINSMRRQAYSARINSCEKQMLRLAKQGNIFVTKADNLSQYSLKIPPLDGYEDIVVHGDAYGLAFTDMKGKETNLSAKEFCDIIEKAGIYKGGKIRLISCQTGEGSGIVPTYMAKRFNTEVLAPTEIVNVDFDGNMILANDNNNATMGIETGKWVRFNEKGKIE